MQMRDNNEGGKIV